MSVVKTEKILALDGTETTEVLIPSLDHKLAEGTLLYNGQTGAVISSRGIESVVKTAVGSYTVYPTVKTDSTTVACSSNTPTTKFTVSPMTVSVFTTNPGDTAFIDGTVVSLILYKGE